MDIGKCTAVSNMSIWVPPLDEQRFLGDKHKCYVFHISAGDMNVWITFKSDSVIL